MISGRTTKWIIYLALVVLLVFTGRYIYMKMRYPENNILNGVPSNAIILVEGKGFLSFAEVLAHSDVWRTGFEETQHPDHFRTITDEINKAVDGEAGISHSLFREQPFCVSLIPKKQKGPGFLVLIQLNRGISPSEIHTSFKKLWPSYKEKKLLEISYHERVLPNGDALYITVKDGLLIASCDREIFELAYYTLESGNNIRKDKGFVNVRQQLSKSQNHIPRLYFSHEGLYGWFARFMAAESRELIARIPETGLWSATELAFSEKGLHLQGFTHIVEGASYLAQSLKFGGAVMGDPAKVLPSNTLFYDQIAISDFNDYLESYVKGYREKHKSAITRYPVPISKLDSLRSLMNQINVKSLTTAFTDPRDTTPGGNHILLIQTSRLSFAEQAMTAFADSAKGFAYQGYTVYPFETPNIIPALFGDRYQTFEEAYFAFCNDYMIITPKSELMMSTINAIMLNRTLSVLPGYSESNGKVNSQLSQRYYFNRANSVEHLTSKIILDEMQEVEKFLKYMPQQVLVSFIKEEDVILTDIVVYSDCGEASVQGTLEIVLDDIPSTTPVLMKDHRSSENKVFIADRLGHLYLLNNRGGIEWKFKPMEEPLSSLEVIDLYKNGRQQCMFLSRHMLHIVQADGKYVSGYPVKLPSGFNCCLSVFDYEKNGNYRIIYSDVNGRFANIDVAGRRVAGWVMPLAKPGCRPITYYQIGGTDILVATDSLGQSRFLDRRGNERFTSSATYSISPKSGMAVTYSLGVPYLSFVDMEGHICQVSTNGTFSRHETIKFSGDPELLAVRNPLNEKTDIVVVEPGLISVYDNELKMTSLIHLQDFSAISIQGFLSDKIFLCAGIDNNGLPFLISRKDFKIIRFTDKSYDGILVWREKGDDVTYILLNKGSMIQIETL